MDLCIMLFLHLYHINDISVRLFYY